MNAPPEIFIINLRMELPSGTFHPSAVYWRNLNVILLDAENSAWQHLEHNTELSKKAMVYIASIITHELIHWLLSRDISDAVSDQFDFLDEKAKVTKRIGRLILENGAEPDGT